MRRPRKYNTKRFRNFALRLKKRRLWTRFIVIEYYFRFYANPENTLKNIIEYIEDKDQDNIMHGEWFNNIEKRGTYFDGKEETILLKDFCKHYKI